MDKYERSALNTVNRIRKMLLLPVRTRLARGPRRQRNCPQIINAFPRKWKVTYEDGSIEVWRARHLWPVVAVTVPNLTQEFTNRIAVRGYDHLIER